MLDLIPRVSLALRSAAAIAITLLAASLMGAAQPAAALARHATPGSMPAASALGAPTAQVRQKPRMSRAEKTALIKDFLAEKGYKPTIDRDGDVKFSYQSLTLFIGFDDDDSEYYRVVAPNFWSLDTAAERLRAPSANTEVTALVKAAKVYTVRQDTWCAVEGFYASVHDFLAVLERSIRTCYGGVTEFARAIRKKPAASARRD